MRFYYNNPKTRDLIIYDSEDNDILVIEAVKSIRVFTVRELKNPEHEDGDDWNNRSYREREDQGSDENKKSKKGKARVKITPELEEKVKALKAEGKTLKEITDETGISIPTVYRITKTV